VVISNLEYGGAQRQVVELANNMDPARYDIHICSLSDYVPLQTDLHDADKRLHIIQKRWMFDASVVPKLAVLARKLKIDVLHSFLFDAEIASRLAGVLACVPAVIGSERNSNYRLKKRQLLAYHLTRRAVDMTIANSTAGAVFNARLQNLNMSCYRVVHNGVNTTRFHPRSDSSQIKQSLGIARDERLVGMFASFKAQKNHPLAFAAMKRVLNQIPEARFVMVGEELYAGMHGSDEYRRNMEHLVDEMDIRSRCYFLGNRDDVEKLYCACDVTILPSLFEGTPNALLESMACGVPVVATDVADNAKIVLEGKTGFIVPLGDDVDMAEKIVRLLRNEALREQLGLNARQWVLHEFSCKRLAEKTAALYDEALAHNNRKHLPVASITKRCGKDMRVVLVTHFPSQPESPQGGVEAVSVVLANALAALPDMEIHVVSLDTTIKNSVISTLKSGVIVHRVPAPKGSMLLNSIWVWKKIIWRYLDGLSPDIVHAHDTYGIMVKGLDCPRIVTIHGFIHTDILVSGKRLAWLKSRIWRVVEMSSWADHPHIISINPYVRERLAPFVSGDIHDIENPIDECFFNSTAEEIKGIIFSSAVISPRKNTLALINAFDLLLEEFPDVELRLAGPVTDREYGCRVIDRIQQGRLAGKVSLLGQIDRPQILQELARASIFALVSLEESAPLGIAEAMAVGVPVVTSDRCGMPYMLDHGKNGCLVDPLSPEDICSRLKALLTNEDLRAEMGYNGMKSALNNFNPGVVAEKTKQVYQAVIQAWRLKKNKRAF